MKQISYSRHRFPGSIIQHAVWLYFRFPLSFRDVEDMLTERGIDVSYESVRRWHLDEVFVRINGEIHYLWRAVDHEGEVLEVFATKRRDRRAALKFLRKAMKRYGRAEVVVTDRLRSYHSAMKVIGNSERQLTGRWLNNRAENSHQPFRRQERAMAKFRSAKSLQKFAAVHASIHNRFIALRKNFSAALLSRRFVANTSSTSPS